MSSDLTNRRTTRGPLACVREQRVIEVSVMRQVTRMQREVVSEAGQEVEGRSLMRRARQLTF